MSLPEPLQRFKEDAEVLLPMIEEKRGTAVVPLLYSMNRYIAKPDIDALYDVLRSAGDQTKIDVVLFSTGGDPDQAYLAGTMLQNFARERLVTVVPRLAKSAATLIACAADEIIMLPPSELGPIDPVVEIPETKRYVPVLSFLELIELLGKRGLSGDLVKEVLRRLPVAELGDYTRLTEHTVSLAERLLARRMFKDQPDKARPIAERLCKGYKSHSAAIALIDARELGLRLADLPKEVSDMVWSLHRLWIDTVIEYEAGFPEGAPIEPINFNVGKGMVFCVQLRSEKGGE